MAQLAHLLDQSSLEEANSPEVEAAYAAVTEGVGAILEGVFILMNRPRTTHVRVASKLGALLIAAFEEDEAGPPGGWIILDEPELHLGRRPDKFGPDLAGWHRERLPPTPEGSEITVAPDWVCEVLSPSTEDIDRLRKWRIYRREGVHHYWIIDPAARTLEVYALEARNWVLVGEHGGDGPVRAPPFEALELPLGRLWTW